MSGSGGVCARGLCRTCKKCLFQGFFRLTSRIPVECFRSGFDIRDVVAPGLNRVAFSYTPPPPPFFFFFVCVIHSSSCFLVFGSVV